MYDCLPVTSTALITQHVSTSSVFNVRNFIRDQHLRWSRMKFLIYAATYTLVPCKFKIVTFPRLVRGREIGIVTRLQPGRSGFRIPVEPFGLALGPIRPIQWVPGLFPGGKEAGA
jgi:hypothetical protein